MNLREFHKEILKITREDARKHSTRLLIIGSSMSVLFTFMFYVSGIFEHDPRYKDVPLALSLGVMLLQNWIAVMITQIGLTYLKCFGKTTGSKVLDWYPSFVFGFWNFVDRCYGKISDFILSERVKQKISDGMWYYLKLHQQHDPLYKAELDTQNNELREYEAKNDERVTTIENELQRLLNKIRYLELQNKIKDQANIKLRNQKKQTEYERDQARKESAGLRDELVRRDSLIHALRKTIYILSKLVKILKSV